LPLHIEQGLNNVRPLPFVVHKILELAKEDPVDFHAMSRTVASDQTLSALIMSIANSAGLSNRYKQITSLKQAMLMLGRQYVVQIVVTYTFQCLQSLGATKWPLGGERFWRHCLAVGTMASQIAMKIGLPYPEEAFVAGLMHDIGKIVLLNEYKTAYTQLLQSTRNNLMPMFLNEKKLFGCNHAEVGAALCIRWRIPSPLISAVEEHHFNPNSVFAAIVNLVGTANRTVKLLGFGDGSDAFICMHPHAGLALTRLAMADKLELYRNLASTVDKLGNVTLDRVEKDPDSMESPAYNEHALYFDLTNQTEREFLLCAAARLSYTNLGVILSLDEADNLRGDLQNLLITDRPEIWEAKRSAWNQVIDYGQWRQKQPPQPGNRVNYVRLLQWLERSIQTGASPEDDPMEAPEPDADPALPEMEAASASTE
jgi:putative nucleotidyltransferase with HDIG domain